MNLADRGFTDSIPQLYERYMVPLIFEPFAVDLAARAAAVQPAATLEIAADIVTLPLRASAESPSGPAPGCSQGTPLRGEIEARAPGHLAEVTALVARAFADRFGAGDIDTRIQAHVVIVGR